jgi:hypothetical protein
MKLTTLGCVALLLLLFGCATPPPSTPPLPGTPPAPPPPREVNAVTVHGQVVSVRATPVGHAAVFVQPADASCRPIGTATGVITDDHGQYQVVIDVGAGPAMRGCAVVEARSGGAGTSSSAAAYFTSSKSDAQPVQVDLRLPRPPPVTAQEALALVDSLAATINGSARETADGLALYVDQGPEALRVAAEQYRALFGTIVVVRPLPPDWSPLPFELRGSTGRTGRVTVESDDLIRVRSPLLDYGFRSARLVSAYIRAIASGDAVSLARLLSPDDIDYPEERARELIVTYRRRYADTATIRAELVDHDERRNTLTWRLRGAGPGGTEISEPLVLRYGDGLLGVVGH